MSLKNFIESASSQLQISAESASAKTSYLANAGAFTLGALTFNEIMMAIATIFGVATFFVNWHYQRKRNEIAKARERREEELHRKRMESSASHPSKSYSDNSGQS